MKNDSVVKTYSGLLKPSPEAQKALDDTHELYNRGARVFQELILNVYGAMTPAIATRRFVADEKKKPKKSKKPKNEREVTADDYPAIGYMLSVFSLETKCEANENYIVSRDRIAHLFKKYWTNEGGGAYNEALIEMISGFNYREDFVFVDRKRMFVDWANSCGYPILTNQDVEFILNMFPFPKVQGVETNDTSQQAWRGFFSANFGSGDKIDWSLCLAIRLAAQEFLSDAEVATYEAYTNFVCTKVGITPEYKQTGRPSWVTAWFKNTGEIPEKVRVAKTKEIATKIKEAEQRLQSEELFPSADRFKNWLEKSIGLEYRTDRDLRDEFSEMAGQAHGRILSTRSNAINQCCDKIKLWNKWQDRPEGIDVEIEMIRRLEAEMAVLCDKETYEIRPKQLMSLKEFHAHWVDKDIEQALEDAAKAFEGKFSYNLFRVMANLFPEIRNRECVKSLVNAVDLCDTLRRYERTQLGGYVHISKEKPTSFLFGCSRPTAKLIFTEDRLSAINFRLLTSNGFEMVAVEVKAKRAVDELFRRFNGTGKAFRNHTLDRLHSGHDEPAELYSGVIDRGRAGNISIRLRLGGKWHPSGDNKWYVDFAPSLEYPKADRIKNFDIDGKQKVMGVDLGWKHAAAYGIMLLGQGEIAVGRDHRHPAEYIEKGVLEHTILSSDGKIVNPLESEGSYTNASDVAWANALHAKLHRPNEKYPNPKVLTKGGRLVAMLDGLIKNLRRTMYIDGPTPEHRATLLEIACRVSPSLVSTIPNVENRRKNTGGLSLKRIELFHNLYKVAKSYLDLLKRDDENAYDPEILTLWKRALKKYDNIRKERYRLTASMIMRKAIAAGVKVVVFENLDGKVSSVNHRSLNRGISSWYTTRIINEVTSTLAAYGIIVLSVDRAYSSHMDVTDNKLVMRLSEVELFSDYGRKKWEKAYDVNTSRKTMSSSRSTEEVSELAVMHHEYWKSFVDDNNISDIASFRDFVSTERKNGNTVLLPIRGGEYIDSAYFGELVSSDVIAACQIAKRGSAYVVSCVKGDAKKEWAASG